MIHNLIKKWVLKFLCLVITYRVLIVQAKASVSTCRPYIILGGTLTDTQALYLPKDRLEFLFQVLNTPILNFVKKVKVINFFFSIQHKNLGILTTLRIGLDDPLGTGRWLIDHVLIRNEITGRAFK